MTEKLISVLKVLSVVAIFFTFALIFRAENFIANAPLTEDGYYSLKIARNIVQGKGITIDGSIKTNGFQPLFTFLITPVFLLSSEDEYLALRYVLLIQWIFYLATALLLALISRDFCSGLDSEKSQMAFWLAFFLYLSSIYIVLNHLNGLETGFLLFTYCLLWRYYQKANLEKLKSLIFLGCLLGFTVLTRVDAVFVVIVISLYVLMRDKSSNFMKRLKKSALLSFPAFLISLPWWVYNLIFFNSLMPSGGKAQQEWAFSISRIESSLGTVSQVLMPWFYLSRFGKNWADLARWVLILIILMFVWLLRRNFHGWIRASDITEIISKKTHEFWKFLIVTALILVFWYTFSSWATHNFGRCFSLFFLISTFAIAVLITQFLYFYKRIQKYVLICILVVPLPLLSAVFMMSTGKFFKGNILYSEQLPLIREKVPHNAYVAAGQTGTLGYFRNLVVNLDGKVNPEALSFQKNMWDYLRKRNIQWFCDWKFYVDMYLGKDPEKKGWTLVAKRGKAMLFKYAGNSS